MACFLVPAGEAIVTTIAQKVMEKKARGGEAPNIMGLKWSRRLSWLNKLLWGGSLLLALEHVWHGEVVPWPPFLTAMENPADVAPMLHEMVTIGSAMAVAITAIWAIAIAIMEFRAKSKLEIQPIPASGGNK